MADNNTLSDGGGPTQKKGKSEQGDFGALTGGQDDSLGNLPPLSAFESGSGGGLDSDMSLPPLGSLDSDSGSLGGLPPIEELAVEEPVPTGGAIKAAPPGFEPKSTPPRTSSAGFETPATPGPDAEPVSPTEGSGTGFQDLSADSHFPQVGADLSPGPGSDLETPMFDSAFGGDESAMGGKATPAPTQAMDTPVFETPAEPVSSQSGGFGFDEGAFGGGEGFEGGGTPMPDFSPDTGMQPAMAPAPTAAEAGKRKAKRPRGGGIGVLATVGIGLAAVVIGIIAGPFVGSKVSYLPNPTLTRLQDAEKKIGQLESQIKRLTESPGAAGGQGLTPEDVEKLIQQRDELLQAIGTLTTQHDDLSGKCDQLRKDLAMIESDIEAKNEEYIEAQESYEDLVNEKSIVEARHLGLLAEVDRLTDRVGQLEDADARRAATKDALLHDINRLEVVVKEGIPLTPEKYARSARLAAVQDLKAKVEAAKWVSPALLEEYSSLYQREMEIAATKTYFFASLPVTDKLGAKYMKWAECLMVGNWAVYYRTLDGKNIGVYENVAESGTPQYALRENLDEVFQKEIEARVFDARTEGFEEKVKMLAERQLMQQGETNFQRAFDSL